MDESISNNILKGTVIIALIGVLAKFCSFITEAVLAARLGTTYQGDAYYMVSSVQNVIYPMLYVGVWNVFLPLYKGHISAGETEVANKLTNKVLSFFFLSCLIVVVILFLFAPQAVSIVAPGFSGETRRLCIKVVRISSPMYIFIVASAIYAVMLQCHNRFLGSQIREVASHIPTIVAAIFFYRRFGIEAIAVALVIAGMFRLLVELPFVNWGYKYKPDINFKSYEFALMLKRLPSAILSASATQINTLIDKAMASTLPEGTISGLNYGHKLTNVLSGLLSSAIATALYPQVVELVALKKLDELSKIEEYIFNIFCVLMIPISAASILFREELVSVVFQRGSFGESSVKLTAGVFALYCIGILFIACNSVINGLFYGFGDTKTPMRISFANLGINVVLNLLFIRIWSVNGLALATSMSAMLTFFIRIFSVKKHVVLNQKRMFITAFKVSVASAFSCGIPRILFIVFSANKYIVLLVSAITGIALYLFIIKMFGLREIEDIVEIFERKIKK